MLDGLSDLRGPPVSLVCEAEYLGTMAAERAAELFAVRNPATRRHFHEAGGLGGVPVSESKTSSVSAAALPSLRRRCGGISRSFPGRPTVYRAPSGGYSRRWARTAPASGAAAEVAEEPAFLATSSSHGTCAGSKKKVCFEGKRRRRLSRWLGG